MSHDGLEKIEVRDDRNDIVKIQVLNLCVSE